jgi:hypothetical protein
MKKLLVAVAVLGFIGTASLTVLKAEDSTTSTNSSGSSSGIVTDKKAFRKDMLAKYDLNHDGKLDKSEKAQMTPEDLAKWNKTFPGHKKAGAGSSGSGTNAPASN